jgi:pyrroloquinoline quinone (PQQ) biosynthesis protein C
MKVRKITTEQKDALIGQKWDGIQYFNPTQDADGNWFISNEEVDNCTHAGVTEWVHELEEIDHNPVVSELPF